RTRIRRCRRASRARSQPRGHPSPAAGSVQHRTWSASNFEAPPPARGIGCRRGQRPARAALPPLRTVAAAPLAKLIGTTTNRIRRGRDALSQASTQRSHPESLPAARRRCEASAPLTLALWRHLLLLVAAARQIVTASSSLLGTR